MANSPINPVPPNMGRGRPSKLSDPSFIKLVAAMFVAGKTRAEMSTECGVSESTITVWRKDARVKAQVRKLIDERFARIVNRADNVLEYRLLNHSEELTVDEIIKIRREIYGSSNIREDGRTDENTVSEAMTAIEQNPGLVAQLNELLTAKKAEDPDGGES